MACDVTQGIARRLDIARLKRHSSRRNPGKMAKPGDDRRLSKKAYEARLPEVRAALVRMQVELKSAEISRPPRRRRRRGFGQGRRHQHPERLARPSRFRNLRLPRADGRGARASGDVALLADPAPQRPHGDLRRRLARRCPPRGSPERPRAGPVRRHAAPVLLVRGPARGRRRPYHQGLAQPLQDRRSAPACGDLESDPRTAWRVTPEDWKSQRDYDRLARLAKRMRGATHQPGAPWYVIDAEDPRARNLAVADILLSRFRIHVRAHARAPARPRKRTGRVVPLRPAGLRRLLALPLDIKLSQASYEKKRDKWLGRLNRVVRAAGQERRSIVWVFEGWDAAGKGGAIRRLTDAIDARDFRVIPVAKPTDEENAHHYLWRFWRHVPRAGMATIYDRSWYGRVLVERLEGFATRAGVAAGLPRAQRIRAGADRARRHRTQILDAHQQGGTAAPLPRPRGHPLQEAQDGRRGLAQPPQVAVLRGRGRRHARADRAPATPPGTSSRPTTSAMRASRSSRPPVARSRPPSESRPRTAPIKSAAGGPAARKCWECFPDQET